MPTRRPAAPDLQLVSSAVAHLPLVRAVIEQLEIPAVLDALMPADPRNLVTDAECVSVMVLNILQGRVALYDMDQWLARTDVELLFGAGVEAASFNDERLAVCLDHIDRAGTETVLSHVVKRYLDRPDAPATYTVHHDTTSLALYGAYDHAPYRAVPARGHSKDHRPDLKQLVFGLSLHGSSGIPLVSTMFSGNTADPVANRFHIEALAEILPEEDEVTLVGDCKLVDARTVGQLLAQGFHFVSLVPQTYGVRERLIEEIRSMGSPMPELARTPGRTKAQAPTVYRGLSFERDFTAGAGEAGANLKREVRLRFLVVESEPQGAQEEALLQRRLARERSRFDEQLAAAAKRPYACAADASAALEKVARKLELYTHDVHVESTVVTGTRPRRGRPAKGSPPPIDVVFRLVEEGPLRVREDAVETLRFHARHFVLITDHLDRETWPDARVLSEYRHQHVVEGTTGFRWLKDIARVAPVFLHTPRRIAALGVVMMLALMVRNYIQFELRNRLVATDSTIPSRLRQPTNKPTAETAMIPFAGLVVVHATLNGVPLGRQVPPLPAAARTILEMLRLDEDIFKFPPPRLFRTTASEMSGM
jgi:transposase